MIWNPNRHCRTGQTSSPRKKRLRPPPEFSVAAALRTRDNRKNLSDHIPRTRPRSPPPEGARHRRLHNAGRRSRRRRSPPFSKARICSASRRPEPARRQRSRFRSCSASNTNRQPPLRKGVRALILSPTRELATQIAESFRTYGRTWASPSPSYSAVSPHKPQRDALARGVDVLVATPGRLLDHMGERNVTLEGTEILVLDEADQMMDLALFVRCARSWRRCRIAARACSSRRPCRTRSGHSPPNS